jgi:predicted Zn-ribbon and HTH transcriptional regulator
MKKLVYLEPKYKCRNCGEEFTTDKITKDDVFLITVDILEMLNDENSSDRLHDKIPHICSSNAHNKKMMIGIADLIGVVSTVKE